MPRSSSIHETLGVIVIGYTTWLVLFGLVMSQIFVYFKRFPPGSDATMIRFLVIAVTILQVSIAIANCMGTYQVVVDRFGRADFLKTCPLPYGVGLIFGVVLNCLVQLFYIRRLWKFTERATLCTALCLLLVTRLGVTVFLGIRTLSNIEFSVFLAQNWRLLVLNWVISVTLDFTTAMSLTLVLWAERKDALKSTIRLIDKIVVWTIETGLATGLISVFITIAFFTMRHNTLWVAGIMQHPTVYTNMLMTGLNGRLAWRNEDLRDSERQDICIIGFRQQPDELNLSALCITPPTEGTISSSFHGSA